MTDRYNCSGDYRDACTLVGQGLRHISLKSPRARRLYQGSGKAQILNTFTIFSANYKYK